MISDLIAFDLMIYIYDLGDTLFSMANQNSRFQSSQWWRQQSEGVIRNMVYTVAKILQPPKNSHIGKNILLRKFYLTTYCRFTTSKLGDIIRCKCQIKKTIVQRCLKSVCTAILTTIMRSTSEQSRISIWSNTGAAFQRCYQAARSIWH